ncbi:MAG: FKBP-type peptidyl-prolyl cis-trans isomerase [Flavobacteriales bacterium]
MTRSFFIVPLLFAACTGPSGEEHPAAPDRGTLIADNQQAMRLEARDIDLYVKRTGLAATATGTGVRYCLLRDKEGPTAVPDQLVTVNYRMELLNGTECYSSKPGEPESFRVEHDDVESGLHEAIQHMSAGDSAILIIPSHRAFGLIGDMAKVPMRSTVVYRIGLVKVSSTSR